MMHSGLESLARECLSGLGLIKSRGPLVSVKTQLPRKERVKISAERKTTWADNPDDLIPSTSFSIKIIPRTTHTVSDLGGAELACSAPWPVGIEEVGLGLIGVLRLPIGW